MPVEPTYDVSIHLFTAKIIQRLVTSALVEICDNSFTPYRRYLSISARTLAVMPPTGSLVPQVINIGRSLGIRCSFSGVHTCKMPCKTPYIIRLQKGLPLSGSRRNRSISTRSVVCQSHPLKFGPEALLRLSRRLTKYPPLLQYLFNLGRQTADAWIAQHGDALGQRSTMDVQQLLPRGIWDNL
jgi:hypothetical protein